MFKYLQLLKQGVPRNDAVHQLMGARASDAPNAIVAYTVCVHSSELRCVESMKGCTGVGGPICETWGEAVEDRQVLNMLPGG